MKNIPKLLIISFMFCQCQNVDLTIKETKDGQVKGVREGDVFAWKGIPYAQPPVGEFRWKPPVKHEPWDGILVADTYGNICPQTGYGSKSIYEIPKEPMSEDCLYLNVWSANPDPQAKLPVMVWIHGGSLTREGGSHPQYLGANLAKKGIVYVSINYRLNAFGFLAHPELSQESAEGVSGNYGILDQIAALEWVKENIANFGGDPNQVTIAGESAGGWSVTLLMASPKAKGLFHRAIMQSGAYMWSGPNLKSDARGYVSGEEEGIRYMKSMGAENIEALRNVSADSIVADFFSGESVLKGEPMIDGLVFTNEIDSTFIKGEQHQVDLMIGANSDEWSLWIPDLPRNRKGFLKYVERHFGGNPALFEKAYPIMDSASIAQAYADYMSDDSFHYHVRRLIQLHSNTDKAIYQYYFANTPRERYPEKYGAFHGAEIVYALDNLENDPGTIGSGIISSEDQAYADVVSSYWVNFVKNGNPNGTDLPKWPMWDDKNQWYLEFGEAGVSTKEHLLQTRLDGFEEYLRSISN